MKNLTALIDLSGTWVDSPVATLLHEKMDEFGIQTQAFSSAWSFGCEIGPESGRIETLESANGKSQIRRSEDAVFKNDNQCARVCGRRVSVDSRRAGRRSVA